MRVNKEQLRAVLTSAGAWAIIALALAVVYLPGLRNTPVFDDRLLTSGDLAAQYGSLAALKPRLLSYGSFVWLQELFGDGWWKQRLVNLFIHVGVVAALWGFYRQVLAAIEPPVDADGKPAPPYVQSPALVLAIGVFALNPVAVYAVAYLVQRSILMATLFVVLALWAFARGLATGKKWLFPAALACYVLAVLAKEHALMAPLAAVPVYIVVARPSARRLALLGGVGALLVAAVGALLTLKYGEIIGKPFDEYSRVYIAQLSALGPDVAGNAFLLSIVNQAYLFFHYGFHWLVPYAGWMSIDMRPPFPVALLSFPHLLGLLGYAAVLVGGGVLVARYRDGRALAGLCLLLPATLFVTEFSTVWVQDPFVLYRSYLWAIGIPGLVLLALHGLSRRLLLVLGVALAAAFAWQGLDRTVSLATPEQVWSDAIAKLPNDPRAVGRWFPHVNRAEVYLDQNRMLEAFRDFQAASALGDKGIGMYNIAAMLGMVGKYRESLRALDEARRLGYEGFGLEYQRGVALYGLGDYRQAYASFGAAMQREHPPAMDARIAAAQGKAAKALGDRALAIGHYKRVSELAPADHASRVELGTLYMADGNHEAALAVFNALIGEAPTGQAHFGRALAHHGLKRKAEALADIETAIRLGPDNAALRQWQAKIQAMP